MLQRIARRWRELLHDSRGAVIIYVTLGLTVFMGFSALAIDGSYLYFMSNRAQSAADAAALAGASQLPDQVAAETLAIDFAEKNLSVSDFGNVLAESDIAFGSWDAETRVFTIGANPSDAIQVVVRMSTENANPVQLFFANALGFSETGVTAASIATSGGPGGGGLGENCLQALNQSAPEAFRVVGTADIFGEGCNIQVDSCHETQAFVASGDPTIDLTVELDGGGIGSGSINVCGGMSVTPNVNLPAEQYVNDLSGESAGDPFDTAPYDALPSAGETESCNFTNFSSNRDVTLVPGVYCGGISLSGNRDATFQSGTYYIKNGSFDTTGNMTLYGEEVTFVLTGASSNLDLGGTSSMSFSAPTEGTYAGFVFFGDPSNPATAAHRMHGTPLGAMHGITYFPGATVELLGTVGGSMPSGTDDCSVLIADKFFFNGTVELNLSAECSDYQGLPPFEGLGPMALKLVD